MMYLFLSILFSTSLMVAFHLFKRYDINTFQAIVFNYFTASTVGFLFAGIQPDIHFFLSSSWYPFAIGIGALFISLFLLIAISTQVAGMAITSVANKMSLIIPVVIAFFIYGDKFPVLKLIGLVLGLVGVCLSLIQKQNPLKEKSNYLLPIIIFFGSGIADASINYVEKIHLSVLSPHQFTAYLFLMAAITGSLVFLIKGLKTKFLVSYKTVIAGIALGIPNYFSIHFLFLSLKHSDLSSSTLFTVNNMGIVLLSAFVGVLLFKEKLSSLNWMGIGICILALLLMGFANE